MNRISLGLRCAVWLKAFHLNRAKLPTTQMIVLNRKLILCFLFRSTPWVPCKGMRPMKIDTHSMWCDLACSGVRECDSVDRMAWMCALHCVPIFLMSHYALHAAMSRMLFKWLLSVFHYPTRYFISIKCHMWPWRVAAFTIAVQAGQFASIELKPHKCTVQMGCISLEPLTPEETVDLSLSTQPLSPFAMNSGEVNQGYNAPDSSRRHHSTQPEHSQRSTELVMLN